MYAYSDEEARELVSRGISATLGRGNYGVANLLSTPQGEVVHKILYTDQRGQDFSGEIAGEIKANIDTLKPHTPKSFAEVLANPAGENWYLREHVRGKPANELLPRLKSTEKHALALAYGTMIADAHASGILVASHGWDDFVFDGKQGKLIDAENAALFTDANIPWHVSRRIGGTYASREQLLTNSRVALEEMPLLTAESDIESFALLLDQLYLGNPLRISRYDIGRAQEKAKRNQGTYPHHRRAQLPAEIKEQIHAVCSYPREKITLDEILQPLKKLSEDTRTDE